MKVNDKLPVAAALSCRERETSIPTAHEDKDGPRTVLDVVKIT